MGATATAGNGSQTQKLSLLPQLADSTLRGDEKDVLASLKPMREVTAATVRISTGHSGQELIRTAISGNLIVDLPSIANYAFDDPHRIAAQWKTSPSILSSPVARTSRAGESLVEFIQQNLSAEDLVVFEKEILLASANCLMTGDLQPLVALWEGWEASAEIEAVPQLKQEILESISESEVKPWEEVEKTLRGH